MEILKMRIYCLILVLAGIFLLAGCSSGGGGQDAFYHNNREHSNWVKNPSDTPNYRNPATGGPMFY